MNYINKNNNKNINNYIILIPHSESKTNSGDETKPYRLIKNIEKYNYFSKSLWIEREKIYGILRETISKKSLKELEKIFEIKDQKLIEAISLNEDLLNFPTEPAILKFNGIMFKEIDYQNLNPELKININNSIFIIDPLFGILKSTDFIPNYKLKFNSNLIDLNPAKFWNDNLKPILETLKEKKILINLLPETHSKIIETISDKNIIKIKFQKTKNKSLINSGHSSKILRGEIIKYLSQFKTLDYSTITKFKSKSNPNLKFNNNASSENEIIFSE